MLHSLSLSLRRFGAAAILIGGAIVAHAQSTLPPAQVGQNYTYQVTTSPAAPAGTVYSASGLPAGISINASSGLISGVPTVPGTANGTISLTSNDTTNSFAVVLVVNPAAGTPAITSALTASATVGQAFTYTVTAGNSPTSFNVGALPAGLAFTTPTISGTPTAAGTYAVSLSANNASGTGATSTLTLTVAPAGPVPVITSATTATATPNAAFSYQVTASNSPTAYAADGLPFGVSINSANGQISGTPTVAGVYQVALSAANANGTGNSTILTLTVGSLSRITSSDAATLTVDQAGSFQLTASNGPLSFNVAGLPPGVSVNTATGLISGTPTVTGTYTVTVSANNATGPGAPTALTLTIQAAPPAGGGGDGGSGDGGGNNGGGGATAPVFTLQPEAQSVTAGTTITMTAEAAGTAPISYQWRRDGAPISGATSATLTFVAAPQSSGVYTLAATNAAGTTVSAGATVLVAEIVVPPTITGSPSSQTAGVGGSVTLTVTATGSGPLTYQWTKDGVALAGATEASLALTDLQLSETGDYAVTVTNSAGSAVTVPMTLAVLPSNALLANLSTRGHVGSGEKVLIAGFVVTGNAPKPVLIRAIGPSLTAFGVPGAVADPVLELRDSSQALLVSNDNWSAAPNAGEIAATAARVGAFTLGTNTADSVILTTLQPGLYTATVRGAGGTTGVGLIELYDASEGVSKARLINVSARGEVGTSEKVLIAGLSVSGAQPKRLLIRAAGPALSNFGVADAVANPVIELYRDGVVIARNDDWELAADVAQVSAATAATGAFAFAEGSRDAALLLTLEPGLYSVHVRGVGETSGAALVEVYEVP